LEIFFGNFDWESQLEVPLKKSFQFQKIFNKKIMPNQPQKTRQIPSEKFPENSQKFKL
jgi:hypothetical protein